MVTSIKLIYGKRAITIQQIKDAAQEAYNLYKDNTRR